MVDLDILLLDDTFRWRHLDGGSVGLLDLLMVVFRPLALLVFSVLLVLLLEHFGSCLLSFLIFSYSYILIFIIRLLFSCIVTYKLIIHPTILLLCHFFLIWWLY